ncbi:MAG: phytanoyl-CoA dioxygenase family protein [Rhodocyclaceae bacterium]|nr:phytanoyl-CoA dioxygenase family protein [Rhodocyclaceae bacterium]MBX3668898.1 phytanoyl-CoA dioxygenase family protein [Rhodocyclaceae bacterium]
MSGWDDADTARTYQQFDSRHGRYRLANRALARHAELRPGLTVLDLAAGSGGTVAALLPELGEVGRVDALEPARAMADLGRKRHAAEGRLRWLDSMDAAAASYERVTCGAAIWQWDDLAALFAELAQRLAPGGALVFNIPAAYLGRPDGPGGGADPYLIQVIQLLAADTPGVVASSAVATARPNETRWSVTRIARALRAAGLVPRRWQQRQKLTQAAWCDWLKVPPVSAGLWPQATAAERAERIDAAAAGLDRDSWRPELWLGWTAWRPAFPCAQLGDDTRLVGRPAELRARGRARGVLRLSNILPRRLVADLRHEILRAAAALGLVDARGRWCGGCAGAAHEVRGWVELQAAVAQTSAFAAIAGNSLLSGLVEMLHGGSVRGAMGSVCRIAPPEHCVPATPAHRDSDYLHGPENTWIAWLPLTPCGVPEGVLAVAPGSHLSEMPPQWSAAELQPGDLLLVHAHTLHRACPNLYAARCRLSVDLRFAAE